MKNSFDFLCIFLVWYSREGTMADLSPKKGTAGKKVWEPLSKIRLCCGYTV